MKINPQLSKKCICTAVFAIFLLSSTAQVSAASYLEANKNNTNIVTQKADLQIGESAYKYIQYLTETIGTRAAGTSKDSQAANYVKAKMEELGLKTTLQRFPISYYPYTTLATDSKDIKNVDYVIGSSIGDVKGNIVKCDKGLDNKSFPKDVQGNIALIERGENSFKEKVQLAEAAGASGVIIYNDNSKEPKRPELENYKSSIPVVFCNNSDGQALNKNSQDNKKQNVSIAMAARYSQNVIGVYPAQNGNPNAEILYITSHYDCAKESVGADDNASGVGMMLAMAEQLKKHNFDKEIRFVAFGAEELGLVGSKYYVRNLPRDEKRRSIGNFNFDMVGTEYEKCSNMGVVTVDGRNNFITNTTLKEASIIGGDKFMSGKESRSDHASFYNAGIDSACFIRLTDDGEPSPYYHNSTDNLQHIDVSRINASGKIIFKSLMDVLETSPSKNNINKSIPQKKAYQEKEFKDFELPEGFFKEINYK